MKTIIAGSRNIISFKIVKQVIEDSEFVITKVVSGTARGVDRLGEEYAYNNNVPIKRFKPDWKTQGKRAGILRNIDMGNYADALIALWDGKSKGTKHMVDYATEKGLKIYVGRVNVIEINYMIRKEILSNIQYNLNYYKEKGLIKKYDILTENRKINISYTPGDNPEIEKKLKNMIKGKINI